MQILEEFIHPLIQQYAEQHTTAEDDVLQAINRQTHLKMLRPRMLSGSYQGKLLEFFSQMIRPKHILEMGSYVGYSAICLAKGLQENGQLHTIEVDEELEEIILQNIAQAQLEKQITLHIGNARNIAENFDNNFFDLVFIDADKAQSLEYYEIALAKTCPQGFILIDNILWSGKVLYEQPKGDKETAVLKELNDRVQNDNQVQNILLPIRDGLMLIQKL